MSSLFELCLKSMFPLQVSSLRPRGNPVFLIFLFLEKVSKPAEKVTTKPPPEIESEPESQPQSFTFESQPVDKKIRLKALPSAPVFGRQFGSKGKRSIDRVTTTVPKESRLSVRRKHATEPVSKSIDISDESSVKSVESSACPKPHSMRSRKLQAGSQEPMSSQNMSMLSPPKVGSIFI